MWKVRIVGRPITKICTDKEKAFLLRTKALNIISTNYLGYRETGENRTAQRFCVHQSYLVSWYFEPNQPQRIISGLKETFLNRYIVEMTSKTEIRSEEQSEKTESCRENLWNEIQLKGP